MLATDTDDRVDPLHARKFVAQVALIIQAKSQFCSGLRRMQVTVEDARSASVREGVDLLSYLIKMLSWKSSWPLSVLAAEAAASSKVFARR